MNERARELARRVVGKHRRDVSSISLFDDQIEKFAELIVRECVRSIENTIQTNCETDSEKIGCEFAITDLKEHFGVEE